MGGNESGRIAFGLDNHYCNRIMASNLLFGGPIFL